MGRPLQKINIKKKEGRKGGRKEGKKDTRKEGNLDTGQGEKAETNVHHLTQLEIQNLLKQFLQQKDNKVLIGFYASTS